MESIGDSLELVRWVFGHYIVWGYKVMEQTAYQKAFYEGLAAGERDYCESWKCMHCGKNSNYTR